MDIEIGRIELINHVNRQLSNMFGPCDDVASYLDEVLVRVEKCFQMNNNRYYRNESGKVFFSPYHSGQYSIFLYYLANSIHQSGNNKALASKVYYLNKIMHSVDWYYEIDLPEYWGVEHPLASVLGRAKYSNGLFLYQGCTVGGNNGKYPTLGENIILYSNVTVIGSTVIGDNVVISTGTIIKDETIPSNCMVFGQSPHLIIKQKEPDYIKNIISHFFII